MCPLGAMGTSEENMAASGVAGACWDLGGTHVQTVGRHPWRPHESWHTGLGWVVGAGVGYRAMEVASVQRAGFISHEGQAAPCAWPSPESAGRGGAWHSAGLAQRQEGRDGAPPSFWPGTLYQPHCSLVGLTQAPSLT